MYRILVFCLAFFLAIALNACKNDDGGTCVSCSSSQTPTFVVCEESDGTASVNGQNTGISYTEYISNLVAVGTDCGGQ